MVVVTVKWGTSPQIGLTINAPDHIGQCRTHTGLVLCQKCQIISLQRLLQVELEGVRRANYLQLTKGINSSRRS